VTRAPTVRNLKVTNIIYVFSERENLSVLEDFLQRIEDPIMAALAKE
jgi:hypothetical protein